MKIAPNSKFVLIGDSITDAGRVQPIAEGLFDPLGKGYVTLVEALLQSTYPEKGIRVINVGTSGNTVKHLAERWEKDVLALQPDFLSVCIGVNDVWRQFDLPRQTEIHVGLQQYEHTYDDLLTRTRSNLKGLILMTPFFIEDNKTDAMRAKMDLYGAVVRKLAQKHNAIFVDTQAAFDAWLAQSGLHSAALAWDRVHPNQNGHMILARAFLKAIGYEW